MDAECLNEQVKYLADAGSVTLNIEEKSQLDLALAALQNAYNFEHLQVWGKITGKSL